MSLEKLVRQSGCAATEKKRKARRKLSTTGHLPEVKFTWTPRCWFQNRGRRWPNTRELRSVPPRAQRNTAARPVTETEEVVDTKSYGCDTRHSQLVDASDIVGGATKPNSLTHAIGLKHSLVRLGNCHQCIRCL